MTDHILKTLAPYWDAVAEGRKTFEVRRDNRGFQTGDVLVLQRLLRSDEVGWLTDRRELRCSVTYILTGGQFGIEPDHVVMGLGEIEQLVKCLCGWSGDKKVWEEHMARPPYLCPSGLNGPHILVEKGIKP